MRAKQSLWRFYARNCSKNLYLYTDESAASASAFVQFQQDLQGAHGARCYYVAQGAAPAGLTRRARRHCLVFGSLRHKLCWLRCARLFASCGNKKKLRSPFGSAQKEYGKYMRRQVKYLRAQQPPARKILAAPGFCRGLASTAQSPQYEAFLASAYYQQWQQLLLSPRLHTLLAQQGMRLEVQFHPKMSLYSPCFLLQDAFISATGEADYTQYACILTDQKKLLQELEYYGESVLPFAPEEQDSEALLNRLERAIAAQTAASGLAP
jgi:hypothetical protein